jgi:hypothetical protein
MNLLPLLSLVLDHLLTTVLRQGLELPPSAASDVFASAGTGSQCTSTHAGYGYVIRIDWNAVTVSTPGELVSFEKSISRKVVGSFAPDR